MNREIEFKSILKTYSFDENTPIKPLGIVEKEVQSSIIEFNFDDKDYRIYIERVLRISGELYNIPQATIEIFNNYIIDNFYSENDFIIEQSLTLDTNESFPVLEHLSQNRIIEGLIKVYFHIQKDKTDIDKFSYVLSQNVQSKDYNDDYDWGHEDYYDKILNQQRFHLEHLENL